MSTSSTMSEQEKNNINEMQKILDASSQYVSIQERGKTVLQFLTDREKSITEVEKEYNGQKLKKVRFIVKDPNSGSEAEKFFDMGKRSARLILDKLREQDTRH
jgi:hypothetical protein